MGDFSECIDRTGSSSSRWTEFPPEVLALTTGDIDFALPPPIRAAIDERLAHGVLGYDAPPARLTEAILDRLQRLYGWEVQADWLVYLPGVVPGLNMACRAFVEPGKGRALTETPVYYPFLDAPANVGRQMLTLPVVADKGRWLPDFDALEAAAARPEAQLLLLCHPQNPTGRLARREELERIADICLKHGLVVCSDEIHAEITFDGGRHLPFASLAPEVSMQTVTLSSPSKSHGISGLGGAFAVIENPALRRRFRKAGRGLLAPINCLALVAMEAAYTACDAWLADFMACLADNRRLLEARLAAMPGLASCVPEATYFQWIDFAGTGWNDPHQALVEAGLALSDGARFGMPGFLRLNFATPEARLLDALQRLEARLAG